MKEDAQRIGTVLVAGAFVLMLALAAGCGRPDMIAMNAVVDSGGAIRVNARTHTPVAFRDMLRGILQKHGFDFAVRFVCESNLPCGVFDSAAGAAADGGCYYLSLQLAGNPSTQRFDFHPGCGPKTIDIHLRVRRDRFEIAGQPVTMAELKTRLAVKPGDAWGYRVRIACDADGAVKDLYAALETCNACERAVPYLVRRDAREDGRQNHGAG
jgi:hypothetical protein